jgi:hypothetical protein
MVALALAQARLRRGTDPTRLAEEGLRELERNGLAASDDYGYSARYLSEILERRGRAEEARSWRERSEVVLRKVLGPDHPASRRPAAPAVG